MSETIAEPAHPDRLQFGFGRRLPVVLQAEAAECGMACLVMVLGYYGHRVDLGTMRRRHALSLKGMTLRNLVDLAGTVGLASRALRVDLADLARLRLPCVLHWGLNHFVVLQKVGRRGIVIHDPARGRRRVGLDEVSREFTGVALELNPTAGFVKAKAPATLRLRDLFRNIAGLGPVVAQILIMSLGIELVALLLPIASQIVVDEVIVNADYDLLLVVAVGLALLLLTQLALGVARTWALMLVGAKLNYQWSGSLFDHLSRLPLDYFEKRHVGDVISRFGSMATVQKALTTDLVQAVLDGIMSVLMLAMIVLYGHWLAIVVLVSTLLNATLRVVAFRAYRESTEEAIVAEARQQSHFIETVRGIASVQAARHSRAAGDDLDEPVRHRLERPPATAARRPRLLPGQRPAIRRRSHDPSGARRPRGDHTIDEPRHARRVPRLSRPVLAARRQPDRLVVQAAHAERADRPPL